MFFLCVVHKLLAWLVVSSAIYYKLELLLLWTFKAPHIRELVACWFCVFFPKTFENESLKNFCTSIAVYNPSFISGFASRLHIRRDRQNITALFLLLFHKFTRSDLIEFSSKLCVCCNIYIQDLSAARVPRSKLPESVPLVERKIARVFLRFLLLLDF